MAKRICKIEDCERPANGGRGWCSTHYSRWRTNGDPLKVKQVKTSNMRDRILLQSFVLPNGCWLWTGSRNGNGYGILGVKGKQWQAHRLSYTTFVGPIPDGMVIDHKCTVIVCVNPRHLDVVTPAHNVSIRLYDQNRTKSHCPQGHPYNEENTKVDKLGRRFCRTCRRARDRARWPEKYARQKAREAAAEHS